MNSYIHYICDNFKINRKNKSDKSDKSDKYINKNSSIYNPVSKTDHYCDINIDKFYDINKLHYLPSYTSYWSLKLYNDHITNLTKKLSENKIMCEICNQNPVFTYSKIEPHKIVLYKKKYCDKCINECNKYDKYE